jgi:iron complex transport system substrate-binding protein
MRRVLWILWLVSTQALAQYSMRDDLQREVPFDRPPQRVITLLPSLTETVCALGECARLVATDRYSDWPRSVVALPKAGGLDDAQIETIVSLRPDVVLLSRSARVTERLAQLGVKTFAVEAKTYDGIAHTISVVAQVLGVPAKAVALNEDIQRGIDALSREGTGRRRAASAPSVYFEVDAAPYAAGESSFIGELLTRLGARNIVPAELGPFPKLNPEYVVRHDPDVIFVSPKDGSTLAQRPGWAAIRAVREHRLCMLGREATDTVVRPGPRVVAGMRALDECLDRVAP